MNHYHRWLTYSVPTAGRVSPGTLAAYFWAHVDDETDDCVLWPYNKQAFLQVVKDLLASLPLVEGQFSDLRSVGALAEEPAVDRADTIGDEDERIIYAVLAHRVSDAGFGVRGHTDVNSCRHRQALP